MTSLLNKSQLWRINKLRLVSVSFIFIFGHCFGQGKITVTFDADPSLTPGSGRSYQQYYEAGMLMKPLDGVSTFYRTYETGSTGRPTNGTAYLQLDGDEPVEFSRTDNIPFSLLSVDLAAYSVSTSNFNAHFFGYRGDGSVVSNNFTGNGLAFHTHHFSTEFTNLVRVEAPDFGSLDNLVVQPSVVPPVLKYELQSPYYLQFINLQMTGVIGLKYRVECSPDFSSTNWTALTNFVLSSSPATVLYDYAPASGLLFYRVVQTP